jgi:hypothetical protein
MDTAYLSEALQDGLQMEDTAFGDITLHHHTLGELVLTTGSVVACDPAVFPEKSPFTVQVPPGRYPVIVSVATFADDTDHRIAYAILKFSEQAPVYWEMAIEENQDVNALGEDEIFCYPVDAGIGCFMDVQVGKLLQQRGDDGTDFADQLFDALFEHSLLDVRAAHICMDDATGANVIAFSSGWGDGCYASYWGYDVDNKIVCLVTDFDLLGHPFFLRKNRDDSSD